MDFVEFAGGRSGKGISDRLRLPVTRFRIAYRRPAGSREIFGPHDLVVQSSDRAECDGEAG